MITAAEAKEKSLEIIAKNAKEYISNTVAPKIEKKLGTEFFIVQQVIPSTLHR